jgi:hypothetical protein
LRHWIEEVLPGGCADVEAMSHGQWLEGNFGSIEADE